MLELARYRRVTYNHYNIDDTAMKCEEINGHNVRIFSSENGLEKSTFDSS